MFFVDQPGYKTFALSGLDRCVLLRSGRMVASGGLACGSRQYGFFSELSRRSRVVTAQLAGLSNQEARATLPNINFDSMLA